MGFLCIAWWDIVSVQREDKDGSRQCWSFSPSGISRVDCWVLMHWRKERKCEMGHFHSVEAWDHMPGMMTNNEDVPTVPKDVVAELKKKTRRHKIKPWPGSD